MTIAEQYARAYWLRNKSGLWTDLWTAKPLCEYFAVFTAS